MTTSTPRIPRNIEDFNSFINNTTAYLLAGTPVTNAERLGILTKEVTNWTAFGSDWKPEYTKYTDKRNNRTPSVTDKLHIIISQTVDFDQDNHILDRIAASPNVTVDDLGIFNIKKGVLQKETRTTPTTSIIELVYPAIKPLGGGSVAIKCKSISHSRAAIHDEANSVQYAYVVGDIVPTSAEAAGLFRDISTKAAFTLNLGADKVEKHLYIYFRWYNTKHPELAGPWSPLSTSLIL